MISMVSSSWPLAMWKSGAAPRDFDKTGLYVDGAGVVEEYGHCRGPHCHGLPEGALIVEGGVAAAGTR